MYKRIKFRLETNSTVVLLYASGVSLISPDVQFGMVSLDWVTHSIFEKKINNKSRQLLVAALSPPYFGFIQSRSTVAI